MDKIAIVVQRYSKDVNGGAELHARLLAEHLNEKYDVDVITTCAKDYLTWENYYPEGVEDVDGIKVFRFGAKKKDMERNSKLSRYLYRIQKHEGKKVTFRNFIKLSLKKVLYRRKENHDQIFDQWMEVQGPLCPDLVNYVNDSRDKYAAYIFFTYLYYPTYIGIQHVASKSILIPTAHDELPFYFSGFSQLFSLPKFFMYNTLSEKRLVERTYPESGNIKSDIAGVGFDRPILDNNYIPTSETNYKYFVYIGRIDVNKGCKELIEYFEYFKKTDERGIKLVMIGNNIMKDRKYSDDIIFTGFIDEQEKLYYLKNSEALIIPSRYESLSMVTLEAMIMGKPVLANDGCEVLKSHIETSNAGYTFKDKYDFGRLLHKIMELSEIEKSLIADNGISYVENNYQWSTIIDKFEKAIDYIKQ